MDFKCKSPCKNCPYRVDAPLQLWHKDHYIELMANDKDELHGKVYKCHKNNGSVCIGWLMDQYKRNCPSIQLRLALIRKKISWFYLRSLRCKSEMYGTIKDMVSANFPELLDKQNF